MPLRVCSAALWYGDVTLSKMSRYGLKQEFPLRPWFLV